MNYYLSFPSGCTYIYKHLTAYVADVGISDVQMEIPMDLFCNETQAQNEGLFHSTVFSFFEYSLYYCPGYMECQTVVASVIIKDLPEYLDYRLSK